MTDHLLHATLALILMVAGTLATGCTETDRDSRSSVEVYDVRGTVVERLAAEGSILVDHAPIEGYMPAMTMAFTARDPDAIGNLRKGDAIAFQYHVGPAARWIERVEVLRGEAARTVSTAGEKPERVEPTHTSIYRMDAHWTTATGERLRLEHFHGRPVIAAMIFTHCSYACPLIVRDVKAITSRLPSDLQGEVQRLLISIDPERDTPAVLTRFADAHGLGDGWTLLRGAPEDVRTLAALFGVRYKPDGDGQFAHTNLITLLDAEGEIVHQQEGLGADPASSARALRASRSPD